MVGILKDILKLLRVKQYVKNVLVFVPLVFGRHIQEWKNYLPDVILTFIIFSFASSSIYIFNDIMDREKDRQHPVKSKRPIASGRIKVRYALILMVILLFASLIGSLSIDIRLFIVILLFILNNLLYTLLLKKIQLLDVFSIALGYILRVYAGAIAADVVVSHYLFLTVFFLALFLAFGKRRYEIMLLEEKREHHRKTLKDYSVYYLDQLMNISATMSLIIYVLYIISTHPHDLLVYTIPVVTFGIFRYYHITHNLKRGEPSDDLISDMWIISSAVLYIIIVALNFLKSGI